MSLQRRTRTPIGLDIGSGGLRAAQLTRRGDHFTMTAFAGHSRAAGLANHDIDTQTSLLRRALRTSPFRGYEIWAALDPPALEFLPLELPTAVLTDPDTDLDEVTRWEVERMIGESASDVETRYWTLPSSNVPGPNTIAVAAKRDHVLKTLAMCRSVGWACTRVDAGAAALARFGNLLHPWDDTEIWGLLDIGLNESRVMLCAGDEPVLVRRAGPGGDAWTQRIAEALGVSANAAETHKRDHGIALTRGAAPHDNPDSERSELAPILLGALRSDLREIASEVKRSYEYVLSRYPDRHAADLVLIGGSSALKNLPDFLGAALGIPVRRASEFIAQTGCRLTTGDHHPHTLELLAKAVGAAIPG